MKVISLRKWNEEQLTIKYRQKFDILFSKRKITSLFVFLILFNIQPFFNKNHTSQALMKIEKSSISKSTFLQAGDKNIKTIVIDAGHGGKDPGCIGNGDIYEKHIALDIALKLGKLIEDSLKGVKVIYTRKTDVFIELYQRALIANTNNADIFISIHCNSNPNPAFHGFESYIMGTHKTAANLAVSKRENESILLEKDFNSNSEYEGFDPNSPESDIIFSLYQNAFMEQSARLASNMHESIIRNKTIHTKEVKQAGFLVLWKTSMPSVLVESGFLSNANDLDFLNSDEGRKKLAHSMMIGFRNYRNWYSKL